ncbi:flagellar hook-basal body complex protein FliE [Vibrio sp. SS-MA-C1-2]|uniref:flagellar hook-basal body complex protein FliE n=1 Tax=Vibrio sp. SS-MA-C1-2 TaxID=2908646 RepID=UPI001F2688B1|nr:flagellar hook-basal body complex protein FliE [Vibrio sp. SS-MA-C1-2]UJF20142.1 flagellar hook-basal body complex protein FliE [Vibrio sp. SS-MA-C1-2]
MIADNQSFAIQNTPQVGMLNFGSAMGNILDNLNNQQQSASQKVQAVELGLSDDLIGATIANQKASLTFNALMQVRNKMVSNFNDIIKMPI